MGITIDVKKLDTVDKYINSLNSILDSMQTKKELDTLINLIINVEKEYNYFKREDKSIYKDVALKIRGFVKNLIFNGNLPDNDYLCLYVIFDKLEIERDDALFSQISILTNSLNNLEDNSIEKIITNEVIFLIDILNSNTKEGFERYLKENLYISTSFHYTMNIKNFLFKFVELINLNFNDIAPVIDEVFEKEFYLHLPYEKQRSICNWSLHILYNIKNFFSTSKWTIYYPKWKDIFYEYLKNEEIDKAMYLQFFIYHFMGNSFQNNSEWKSFNEEINIPASRIYKEWGIKNSLKQPKNIINTVEKGEIGFLKNKLTFNSQEQTNNSINKVKKIKIALLVDRITFNSQFKVEFSVLKALTQSEEFNKKYEIKIYTANYFEKKMDDSDLIDTLKSIGIEVCNPVKEFVDEGYYHSHLKKALKLRETFIKDDIDILLTNMNGHGINTFLLSTRCAPKQVYFSHGEYFFNIDGIDDRLVMGTVDRAEEEIINGFKFYVYKNIVDIGFLNPSLNEKKLNAIKEIKSEYPENTLFLGTIGRLIKLDNKDYIKIVLEILKKYENTIYLACGGGGETKLKELLQEVNSDVKLNNLEEKFIFTGLVNAHIYGNIIDIFLNTFPNSQGTSLMEFSAKRRVVISKYLKDWKDINKFIPKNAIANTNKEYKDLISKAIEDKDFYEEIAKECEAKALYFSDGDSTAKSLIEIFNKIVEN